MIHTYAFANKSPRIVKYQVHAIILYYKTCALFKRLSERVFYRVISGSLPPSPADSGVSDVDSSSSGHTSTDTELRARLQPHQYHHQGQIMFTITLFKIV